MVAVLVGMFFFLTWVFDKERYDKYQTTGTNTEEPLVLNGSLKAGEVLTLPHPRTIFDAERLKPQIAGIPQSAPIFSSLVAVRSVQRLDGCIHLQIDESTECRCNDQRGNIIDVNIQICEAYIDRGFFDFTISDKEALAQSNNNSSRPTPADNKILTGSSL